MSVLQVPTLIEGPHRVLHVQREVHVQIEMGLLLPNAPKDISALLVLLIVLFALQGGHVMIYTALQM